MPGPQTKVIESKADIIFFGGAGGGGKTDMLLGLAYLHHTRSVIFRRDAKQLQAIEDRSREIYSDFGEYNATKKIWRFEEGKQIEFAGVSSESDKEKQRGQPRDLYGFDEITGFTKTQFEFIIGWNRTTKLGQRARVVCTGNPPNNSGGYWIKQYWGAWLDKNHPNPASPGELRWYTTINGKEIEVPNNELFEHNGEILRPLSRTFIPARIDENPFLANSNYKSTLQNLPEPLRSQMLYGDFNIGVSDDTWQVIPTEWVRLAQARWLTRNKPNVGLHALGVDVARGGNDKTVLTSKYGNYFGKQFVYPGQSTPNGTIIVQHIIAMPGIDKEVDINVDVIGVGASVYDQLKMMGFKVHGLQSAGASTATDKSKLYEMLNKRAEWYWALRMSLDPEGGDDLALPDDPELLADLCAPRWMITGGGKIKIEPKEEIVKRIGRSPDKGDSLVYAFATEKEKIVRMWVFN